MPQTPLGWTSPRKAEGTPGETLPTTGSTSTPTEDPNQEKEQIEQ